MFQRGLIVNNTWGIQSTTWEILAFWEQVDKVKAVPFCMPEHFVTGSPVIIYSKKHLPRNGVKCVLEDIVFTIFHVHGLWKFFLNLCIISATIVSYLLRMIYQCFSSNQLFRIKYRRIYIPLWISVIQVSLMRETIEQFLKLDSSLLLWSKGQ